MNILSGLAEAMACIEADLCRPDIAAAARCAGMTADSFARFFSYMCGVTLPVYIRRRRLT